MYCIDSVSTLQAVVTVYPGRLSAYQGSFRCAPERLQDFGERREEGGRESWGWGLSERKRRKVVLPC